MNYEYPPLGGGAATATENFLRECADRKDVDFEVVVSSVNNQKIKKIANNITIHYLDIGKKGQLHDQSRKDLLIYSWKAFFYVGKLKKEQSFDLIHAFFGIPCGFLAMFFNRPYLVSLRGSDVPFYSEKYIWLDRFFFWWISRIIWFKAQMVITNSQGLKDLALKTAPKQKINVIYNGVDTDKFKPIKGNRSKDLIIISTSRIIKRKGVDKLLIGFKQFVEKFQTANKVKLILIGDGEMRFELERMVEDSNLSDCVEFLGPISRNQMPIYYHQADIFALPSLNEGMSNSLLEAMASGLAIMTTDTGGTRELVDEKNGLIIKKDDSHDIAQKIEYFFNNPKKVSEMKKNSREKIKKMSWKMMADQYLALYDEILS